MPIAYHVIFGFYGFWLPNDPRGSWSDYVGSLDLLRYGRATKTNLRRSLAADPHDVRRRLAAKRALHHPPVVLTGRQARAVGRGFAEACREGGYVLHACSIVPDHVHLVAGAHARPVGRVVGHMKGRAHQRVLAEDLWPPDDPPLWGGAGWRVFLDSAGDVARAVRYVEGNPAKEGLPAQRWPFVTPFRTL
jgi:REP element-mobilizing transposase RayT